ncbi:MAG: 50S ribosomal protein L29 [Solirubrobacteraceae bacterium]
MKAKEIRDLTDTELRAHVTTVRKDLFGLRFQNATGELENTAGMRAAKRDLARALTIAQERDIEIEHGSEN